MVLAGAGTGKTRVIASRIAALLQRKSLPPDRILALTFSRKAAQEMSERVESLCGSAAADVGVYTFHGFCHRFLQDHAVELGLPSRLRLLDQIEAWDFFRRLLPDLRLAIHWNLSDPTGSIDGFLRFIHRAKDELVSPEEYAAHARGLGDPGDMARAEEVARVYRLYQERMRRAGKMDFGDLIVETLRAWKGRPALLAELRGQFQAILVDEFQDTNVGQIELLRQIAGTGERLCVVGDDDQAIYRFRGASYASFHLLKQIYPTLRTVHLTRNYRSTATILSVAGALIRRNEADRSDPGKVLRPENPEGPAVELLFCPGDAEEARAAAERIEAWAGRQAAEGQPLREIAVLYRAHAQRRHLLEELGRRGIPYSVRGGVSLLGQPEMRDLEAYLRVLADPEDSQAMFQVVSHPAWGLAAEELVAVGRWAKERELPLERALRDLEGSALSETTRREVGKLLTELDGMRRRAMRSAPDELISHVVEEGFLRVAFRLPPGPAGDPLRGLSRFLRLAARYAENHPEARRLPDFLDYLDSVILTEADLPEEEPEEDPPDRVRLMTIHQAKGLEFDRVILLGMVQSRFPGRARPDPVPFPLGLMKEPLPTGDVHLQEERRLCYVACTRARKELVMLTQERPRYRPSVFVREMLEGAAAGQIVRRTAEGPVEVPGLDGQGLPAGAGEPAVLRKEREALEILRRLRMLAPADEAGFSRALQEWTELGRSARAIGSAARSWVPALSWGGEGRFSFTQLEAYRSCPWKYLYAYVYRIPIRATPQMNLGSDLHRALQWFYQQIMQRGVPPLEELRVVFQRCWAPGRYGEPVQNEGFQRLGLELLSAFYRKHDGNFGLPLHVEKAFVLQWADGRIHGVVDRIDPLPDGEVEIIDYKSGKPKDRATFEEQLQLWLYALAAEEVLNLKPRRVSFHYLQDNSRLSFDRQPDTLELAKQQVLGLVRSVHSGAFEPAPTLGKCRRCDFRRLCPASAA